MDKQQYAQAIQDFERIFELPANLGYTRSSDYEDQRANYLIAWCYEKLGMDDKAKEVWLKTIDTVYEARWDVGAHISGWRARYYQALCLQKLGRWGQANVYLDGLKEYALANKRGSDAILPLESQIAAIRLVRVTKDVSKDESQVGVAGALVEMRTVDVET